MIIGRLFKKKKILLFSIFREINFKKFFIYFFPSRSNLAFSGEVNDWFEIVLLPFLMVVILTLARNRNRLDSGMQRNDWSERAPLTGILLYYRPDCFWGLLNYLFKMITWSFVLVRCSSPLYMLLGCMELMVGYKAISWIVISRKILWIYVKNSSNQVHQFHIFFIYLFFSSNCGTFFRRFFGKR